MRITKTTKRTLTVLAGSVALVALSVVSDKKASPAANLIIQIGCIAGLVGLHAYANKVVTKSFEEALETMAVVQVVEEI